jgi:argininosuccinate synthase
VRWKLYEGSVSVVSRDSKETLFDKTIAPAHAHRGKRTPQAQRVLRRSLT